MPVARGSRTRVAVDIGGTFTDIVLMSHSGVLHESKVSTTPADPSTAVIEGLRALLAELSIPPADVVEVLHGTTVASNTILQRAGALTGLITTRGFRDVLEIGRIRMPEMFDLTWSKPQPLVSRRHRLEVQERIAADGAILQPLDEKDVVAAARELVAAGVSSVAICFINSYRNPAHEQRAVELIRREFPALLVCASHAVLPEMKEYERTSTTVVNAYLLSQMREYLSRLEGGLRRIGVTAPLLVMTSNGGMVAASTASEKPALVVASGPAGGVVGGLRVANARNEKDTIVFDMGGTTAKAVIIEDGQPSMTSEYEFRDGISTSSRFIKAGGYMLKVPAIDIAEVGAGGGSLASIDRGGLLRVGPESAGAAPGPACYNLGNDRPTVTDANVVLGYISPTALAGGQLPIDKTLSAKAIEQHVAQPLGVSVEDAAHGIRAVANAAMSRAVRAVTVERGRDPRDLALIAIGGNGGIHAIDLARQLGIGRVIVPPLSGVFSAVGMLGADIEHTHLKTVLVPLDGVIASDLERWMKELSSEILERLARDGYSDDRVELVWQADLRHEGQATELTVGFKAGPDAPAMMRDRFVAEYLKTYGYKDETAIELVKLRLIGRGLRTLRLDFSTLTFAERPTTASAKSRKVSFERGKNSVDTPVVPRHAVAATAKPGPLIIDEFDATIVVPPDAKVWRDRTGNIVMELGGGA
ncbi:hydantoinase/oxoprolinase family protein [Rhodoplanes sp. Z2-YC6860]|uniref:hydantoinase/oxoprolinase family protein n=1 Tax=Rhodoplanes sp. Z2-YC6860 TaxID=674703 RepID=UPI00078D94FE|nr:hydantoinase/oxoprolinase family protein [Rhodoplanes sp. Z2-YC6860]AMN41483.1 hydantoin utilization protein A [Rhodoplanes sp. Z2-YC6860]